MSTHALSAWDTQSHFRASAAAGDVQKALAELNKLDPQDGDPSHADWPSALAHVRPDAPMFAALA